MTSSEYESETESNTRSVLLIYQELLPTPLPFSLSPSSLLLLLLYNMSQHDQNYVRQLEGQLVEMQAQIQALTERKGGGAVNTEMEKLPIFNGTSSKVSEFVTACRLYIRIKMREVVVKEQI